ncbi:hypothetical protein FRB96_001702 [Tulasnella sp. 330]|nr:hypothetical protein FRB96_001702 [Tulasnella sp. 330]KAG8882128.1 hypothetical protein FRB97_008694 [Tulasnella sp. 331]KAG8887995.1 hypothetical protein FRB98_008593 [Tulasnella sp. 332]
MSATIRSSYRRVLREVYKSSLKPRNLRNPTVLLSFRKLFEDSSRRTDDTQRLTLDMENAAVFMRGQREYSELLKRYNPLHAMTPDEHREATAHRVGLNMPESYDANEQNKEAA